MMFHVEQFVTLSKTGNSVSFGEVGVGSCGKSNRTVNASRCTMSWSSVAATPAARL